MSYGKLRAIPVRVVQKESGPRFLHGPHIFIYQYLTLLWLGHIYLVVEMLSRSCVEVLKIE